MLALSVANVLQSRVRDQELAIERLRRTAASHASAIGAVLDAMVADADQLTGFPPISGIMRATASPSGIDPLDNSSEAQWRIRLQTIFRNTLLTRPHYTQIRFIGQADNWRELVRVNREADGLRAVPLSELQSKGAESYLSVLPATGGRPSYFSETSYNRERGRIDGPPTLRLVRKVYDPNGALFGAIVINADFEQLLQTAAPKVDPGTTAMAITSTLDYMIFRADGGPPRLHFHDAPDWRPPPLDTARLTAPGAGENLSIGRSDALYTTEIDRDPGERPFRFFVVTRVPLTQLYAIANRHFRVDATLAAVILLLSTGAALVAGTRLTRPLTALHARIEGYDPSQGPIRLPIAGRGEIGTLARAFERLSNDLILETAKTRAIFAGASLAIVVVDDACRIADLNPAAADLFGYDPADLIGQLLNRLMDDATATYHDDLVRAFDGQSRFMARDRDVLARRADGSFIPVEISLSRVPAEGRSLVVGIAKDVSDRKAHRERTEALIAALERSNAELDQFAYVASHDLKAPLRVISNAASWLEEDLGPALTDDTRASLDLLRNRARRMERLLDDLLLHSRIGRETGTTDRVVTGAELRANLMDLLSVPDGIALTFEPAFDALSLRQMPLQIVLLNLIANAIKHHDRSAGQITVAAMDHPGHTDFTVTDDGPGIPPEYHEKIFQIFQTLKPRDQVEASGMGLAMVRKYTALAGGRIEVISDGSRGTAFRLHWPKTPGQAPAPPERLAS